MLRIFTSIPYFHQSSKETSEVDETYNYSFEMCFRARLLEFYCDVKPA